MTKEDIIASGEKKKVKIQKLNELGLKKKEIAEAVGCSLVYVYITLGKKPKEENEGA